jgi:hypothetical protein
MDAEALFWTKIAAIGQAVGALATTAAVWTSLWVVLSERAARLVGSAGLRLIIPGDGTPATDIISITITNIGQKPVRVSNIGWITGWFDHFGPEWLRRQHAVQLSSGIPGSSDPPFLIEPGDQKTFLLDPVNFTRKEQIQKNQEFFGRKYPFFENYRKTRVRVTVGIVGSRTVLIRIEKPFQDFLISGKIEKGAASFNATAFKRREGNSET